MPLVLGMGRAATVPPTGKFFTLKEVAEHDTKEDCWIIIEGTVYDISTYIERHPPPLDLVIKDCGKDATLGWNTKGSKNKPHSKKAHTMLQKYELGKLQK